MPKLDHITAKRAHIGDQISQLQRNVKVIARLGGRTQIDLGDEVTFQQRRQDELDWCAVGGRTDTQIRARIADYEEQMAGGPYDYGSVIMAGLSMSEIELICFVECLKLALGEIGGGENG